MKMSRRMFVPILLVVSIAASFCMRAAEKVLSEKGKIEALIKHIEGLNDATFIRNDSEYGAKTAARFLRGKWQAREKEIRTATDFIEKAATVSSTTGKPYRIRFKDAHEVKCGDYLKDQLKKLETDTPEKRIDRG